jgi:hypothetical protein
MHALIRAVGFSLLSTIAIAQPGNSGAAWAHVQSLYHPDPVARPVRGSRDEVDAAIRERGARLRQAAQAAQEFYTSFPTHPRAAEARKIEALSVVRGAVMDDEPQVAAAVGIAQAYRNDLKYAAGDRLEVALALERFELSRRVKAGAAAGDIADRRLLAERLRTEFGELPPLLAYYMEIARNAESATAIELATLVTNARKAPRDAVVQANEILDRAALPGKKLALKLPQLAGAEIHFNQLAGQATVILAWHPSGGAVAATMINRFAESMRDAKLIYLGLAASPENAREASAYARLPGIHCYASPGADARKAFDQLKVQYASLPRVVVLDRAGIVVGSGVVAELPALLAKTQG